MSTIGSQARQGAGLVTLLVDGDEENRSLAWRILSNLGAEVLMADGVESAQQQLSSRAVDLVVCDPAVARRSAALLPLSRQGTRPLPFILLSRAASEAELVANLPIGLWVLGRLGRPLSVDELWGLLSVFSPDLLGADAARRLERVRNVSGERERNHTHLLDGAAIEQVNLTRQLRSIEELKATGRLELPGGLSLYFDHGALVWCGEGEGVDLLGWLVDRELVPEKARAPGFAINGLEAQLGYLEAGRFLTRQDLLIALGDLVADLLCGLPREGRTRFHDQATAPRRFPRTLPVMALSWQVTRRRACREPELLEWSEDTRIRACFGPSTRPQRWGLGREELAQLRMLSALGPGGARLGDVLAACRGPRLRYRTRLLLWWLHGCGLVGRIEPEAWVYEGMRQAELYPALAQSAEEDPFQALGVEQTADDALIRQSYRELSKRFHPDRFFGRPERTRRLLGEIQAGFSRAYEAIGTAERRAALIKELSGERDPDPQKARAEYRMGRSSLERKRYHRAVFHFQEALSWEEGMVLARLYLVWSRYLNKEMAVDAALKQLVALVRQNNRVSEGHLLLGRIYRIKGDTDQALICFERAVTADRENVEAQRELRVLQKRASEGGGASGDASDWLRKAFNWRRS